MSVALTWVTSRAKPLAAVAGAVVVASVAIADNGISGITEWAIVLTAGANAVNLYLTPDLSAGAAKYAKAITGLLLVALGGLTPAVLVGGIDGHELWMIVLAALPTIVPNLGYVPSVPEFDLIEPGQPVP